MTTSSSGYCSSSFATDSSTTCTGGVTRTVGQYGWDGGLGTIWRNDPPSSLSPCYIALDFLTAAYAAIDD